MRIHAKRFLKKFLLALIPGAFVLGLMGCDLVRAPDSGSWQGSAVFRDELYQPVTCDFKLDVMHTDDSLRIYAIDSNCSNIISSWKALSFDIHGDELWHAGELVGHATANGTVSFDLPNPYYNANFPMPAQHVTVAWTMVGHSLEFTQETYFNNTIQRTHAWLNQTSGSSIDWDANLDVHED
ncbi:MAG: hypothetical protein ACXWQO_04920 [Bdellovibrionota bacterium]